MARWHLVRPLGFAATASISCAVIGCRDEGKETLATTPSASASQVVVLAPPIPSARIVEPETSRLAIPMASSDGACPGDMVQIYATCMDRYEAPNVAGQYPLVMESAMTAEKWCQRYGKRLCSEDEWERACAGPAKLTYPYGANHEDARCVDEKEWIQKDESSITMWPEKPAMGEVTRLYQAEKSGTRPRCVSGYGVHDLTGNVEEWVVSRKGRPYVHVLKGCYWSGCYGGSKPSCTATNTAHADTFKFYETGFRCCRDAKR